MSSSVEYEAKTIPSQHDTGVQYDPVTELDIRIEHDLGVDDAPVTDPTVPTDIATRENDRMVSNSGTRFYDCPGTDGGVIRDLCCI